MKKAMVVGASGGMGYALVNELVDRGIQVVAFARGKEKLHRLFGAIDLIEIHTGDAEVKEQIIEAGKDCDVIFHAMNIPYQDWKDKLAVITQNVIMAAERNNAKLAVVDNIYAYGKSAGNKLAENTVKNPHTRKGRLRLEMENMIKTSSVPAFVCHFPDFYGPNATNTYIHYTLEQIIKKKKAGFVGPGNVSREFIYTKDGAKVMVELACRPEAYGHSWNVPAVAPISGYDLEKLLKKQLGAEKQLYFITKPMFAIFALFAGKGMREAIEMQYINSEPTILSGEKIEMLMGELKGTSYEKGIEETIAFMKA